MTDRNDKQYTEWRPGEGVRIIGADEAQRVLDAGSGAGRRAAGRVRHGDVPPAPAGTRLPWRSSEEGPGEPSTRRPPSVTRRPGSSGVGSPRPAEESPWDDATSLEAEGDEIDLTQTDRPAVDLTRNHPAAMDGARLDRLEPGTSGGRGGAAVLPPVSMGGAPRRPLRSRPEVGADAAAGAGDARRASGPGAARREPRPGTTRAGVRLMASDGPGSDDSFWGAEDPETADTSGGGDAAAGSRWASPGLEASGGHADVDDRADTESFRRPRLGDDDDRLPPVSDLAPPREGITVTGRPVLPHWTEPVDGGTGRPIGRDGEDGEPIAPAAASSTPSAARWRNDHDDWDEPDTVDGFFLDEDDQDSRLGALDSSRSDRSDLYSFDEAFQQLQEERSGPHPTVAVDHPQEVPLTDETPPAVTPTRTRLGVPRSRARAAAERSRARAAAGERGRAGADGAEPPRSSSDAPPPVSGGRRPLAARSSVDAPAARGSQNLRSRLVVGSALVVLLIAAYAVGPKALVVLAAVVVLLCAAEAYAMLQRCGFRPATLLGLTATGGLMFAAYWRGEAALPLIAALTFAGTMVWYLLGIVDARPLANVAVTSMTVAWVGLLGSFAALMLRVPHGKGLFLGAVVVTVASDIVAYFAGRRWGRHPLAPNVSPGKTVEGFVAGAVGAVVVGLGIGQWVTPWGGLGHGLLLGVAVAVFAPIGDLFESLIKRDLEVKDSGTVLAGHGGLLDRFDSLLLVLPVTYYLADYLHFVR